MSYFGLGIIHLPKEPIPLRGNDIYSHIWALAVLLTTTTSLPLGPLRTELGENKEELNFNVLFLYPSYPVLTFLSFLALYEPSLIPVLLLISNLLKLLKHFLLKTLYYYFCSWAV